MKLRKFRAASLAFALIAPMLNSGSLLAQDRPLKIGVMNDQTGSTADVAGFGSVIAARLAVEDFGGRMFDQPIEVLNADHQNKPDVASSLTRKWLDVDGVSAVVDGGGSAASLAIQEIVKDKQGVALFSGPATSDLTGKFCSPTGFHWTYDTYALASSLPKALSASGAETWFFLTSDNAFGHALERDATKAIEASGGKVLGSVRHPLATADFSSFLLQAQASGANIIGLGNSGDDTLNAIKQVAEFGLVEAGQRIGGFVVLINTVHGLGLQAAQGIVLTESYYWDMNDETRRFAERFEAIAKKKPNMVHAGVYSAVTHYLKAVKQAGATDGPTVAETMRKLPVNDFMSKDVKIRKDGRVMREMHLFQVKAPSESSGPWDYYKYLYTISGDQAFRPVSESECSLLN